MIARGAFLPLVVVTLVVGVAPACPQPCFAEDAFFEPTLDGTVVPDDGGVLPVNGLVHLARQDSFATPIAAAVRADADDTSRTVDVDDVANVLRVNLDALLPETSYTATLTIAAADSFTGSDIVRDIHFTTTAERDDTPPTLSGEATAIVADFSGPCAPAGQKSVTVTPSAADDDVGVAGIKLFRVLDNGTRELRKFSLADNDLIDIVTGSTANYEIVAVDMAGNESEPVAVDTGGGCTASAGAPALLVLAALVRRRRRP